MEENACVGAVPRLNPRKDERCVRGCDSTLSRRKDERIYNRDGSLRPGEAFYNRDV